MKHVSWQGHRWAVVVAYSSGFDCQHLSYDSSPFSRRDMKMSSASFQPYTFGHTLENWLWTKVFMLPWNAFFSDAISPHSIPASVYLFLSKCIRPRLRSFPSRPRMYDKPYGSTAEPAPPPPLSYPQQLLNTFSVKSSLENKSSFGFSTVNDLSPSAQIL